MANRAFHKNTRTLEAEVVRLYALISFGGTTNAALMQFTGPGLSGAGGYQPAPANGWKGIATNVITRNGVGDYTIALQDRYLRLLGAQVTWMEEHNSGAPPAAPNMYVKADNSAAAGPNVEVVFTAPQITGSQISGDSTVTLGSVATDPGSSEGALIELIFSNSSAL